MGYGRPSVSHYRSGETIEINGYACGGYTTNSGKSLRFSVPLCKPVAPGATLSAPSAWRITARADGGYVMGSADSSANVPASQIKLTAYATFVSVDIETTVERTNNISVGLQVAGTIAIS